MIRATRNTEDIRLRTARTVPVLEVANRPGLLLARVEVAPLAQGDSQPLLQVFDAMSAESRLARFLVATPRLPAPLLRQLTEVDHVDHGAWVVRVADGPVAIGRFVRLATEPEVAEVALEVADSFQGLGIGTLLVEVLGVAAADVGVRELTATIGPENQAARRLSRRFDARPSLDRGLLEGRVPVPRVAHPQALRILACARAARACPECRAA